MPFALTSSLVLSSVYEYQRNYFFVSSDRSIGMARDLNFSSSSTFPTVSRKKNTKDQTLANIVFEHFCKETNNNNKKNTRTNIYIYKIYK